MNVRLTLLASVLAAASLFGGISQTDLFDDGLANRAEMTIDETPTDERDALQDQVEAPAPVSLTRDEDSSVSLEDRFEESDLFLRIVNNRTENVTLRLDITDIVGTAPSHTILAKFYKESEWFGKSYLRGSSRNDSIGHVTVFDQHIMGGIRYQPIYELVDPDQDWLSFQQEIAPGVNLLAIGFENVHANLALRIENVSSEEVQFDRFTDDPLYIRVLWTMNPGDWNVTIAADVMGQGGVSASIDIPLYHQYNLVYTYATGVVSVLDASWPGEGQCRKVGIIGASLFGVFLPPGIVRVELMSLKAAAVTAPIAAIAWVEDVPIPTTLVGEGICT